LVQQIKKDRLSVHLNIAEGCSRKSEAERKRYYEIARGSELTLTQHRTLVRFELLQKKELKELGLQWFAALACFLK